MIATIKRQQPATIFLFVALFVFLVSVVIAIKNDTGTNNLYVHQAEAWLQGKMDIPVHAIDVAPFNGRFYVPFPPFPAFLLLPFAAVFDTVNPTLVAVVLTVIGVLAARDILKRLHVDETTSVWLLAAFFLGTGYWYVTIKSDGVWYFAHVVYLTCMLLSIREAMGKGRGFLAGLFLGFAFLSRQQAVYSGIFIIVLLLTNPAHQTNKDRVWAALSFLSANFLCVLVYLTFNYLRFGDLFDTGYSYIENDGLFLTRFNNHGLFSIAYLPFNFIYMFLQGPHVEFQEGLVPLNMDLFGTSITFASPFLFAAFFAKGNKLVKTSAWVAIVLTLIHIMLYFTNGWQQLNTIRYALDIFPIFLVLVAMSMESIKDHKMFFYWSIVYAISLNIFALVLLRLINGILSITGI